LSDWQRLMAVASAIDPEPLRDRLRSVWGRPVGAKGDDLKPLADSIDVRGHSPATVVVFARALRRARHPGAAVRLLRDAQAASPNDFWVNFELGLVLVQQQDFDGAIRFNTAAVALRPDSFGAHHNLGYALRQRRRFNESAVHCRRAVELDPKSALAHNNLGFTLYEQGRSAEAIDYFRKVADLDPRLTGLAHVNTGVALRALGRPADAAAACQKALDVDANNALAHANLGNALRDLNREAEAFAAYQKAVDLDPECSTAHRGLGIVYRGRGKLPEAAAAFRRAIATGSQSAAVHYLLGHTLREQRIFPEAAAAYRRSLELEAANVPVYLRLGEVLCDHLRDYDQAAYYFRRATELAPASAPAYAGLGNALDRQGKPVEAIAAYQQAVTHNPKHFVAHNNLGFLWMRRGKVDEAAAALTEALRHKPDFTLAQENLGTLAWRLAGDPDPGVRDPGRAAGLVRQLLALDLGPNMLAAYAPILLLVGDAAGYRRACERVLQNHGNTADPRAAYLVARIGGLAPGPGPDPAQLVRLADRAVRAEPVPHYLHVLGLAHYRAGQFDRAIDRLTESVDGNWTANAANWLVMAMAHHRLGHAAEALKLFDKAVRLIDPPWVKEPEAGLKALHRHDFMACVVLRREAEALLGVRAGPDRRTPSGERK